MQLYNNYTIYEKNRNKKTMLVMTYIKSMLNDKKKELDLDIIISELE